MKDTFMRMDFKKIFPVFRNEENEEFWTWGGISVLGGD